MSPFYTGAGLKDSFKDMPLHLNNDMFSGEIGNVELCQTDCTLKEAGVLCLFSEWNIRDSGSQSSFTHAHGLSHVHCLSSEFPLLAVKGAFTLHGSFTPQPLC